MPRKSSKKTKESFLKRNFYPIIILVVIASIVAGYVMAKNLTGLATATCMNGETACLDGVIHVCFDGVWDPKMPLEACGDVECHTDSDCDSSICEICNEWRGECVSYCTSGKVCSRGSCVTAECTSDSQCNYYDCKICSNFMCVSKCPTGSYCDDGTCKVKDCSTNSDCDDGSPCTRDTCLGYECINARVSACGDGTCNCGETSSSCPPDCAECFIDDDCSYWDCEICNNGVCEFGCSSGKVCDDGVCVMPPECSFDSDCNATSCQKCVFGNCVSNCTYNQKCVSGLCQGLCYGVNCGTCKTCDSTTGRCLLVANGTQDGCASGQVCIDGYCKSGCVSGGVRDCGLSTGACTTGRQTCVNGVWGDCVGNTVPVTEVCDNGIDDDCDGITDETECGCVDGSTVLCGTNLGACVSGFMNCTGGRWSECLNSVGPINELCNNDIDDDCDGLVDEGCSTNNITTGNITSNSSNLQNQTISSWNCADQCLYDNYACISDQCRWTPRFASAGQVRISTPDWEIYNWNASLDYGCRKDKVDLFHAGVCEQKGIDGSVSTVSDRCVLGKVQETTCKGYTCTSGLPSLCPEGYECASGNSFCTKKESNSSTISSVKNCTVEGLESAGLISTPYDQVTKDCRVVARLVMINFAVEDIDFYEPGLSLSQIDDLQSRNPVLLKSESLMVNFQVTCDYVAKWILNCTPVSNITQSINNCGDGVCETKTENYTSCSKDCACYRVDGGAVFRGKLMKDACGWNPWISVLGLSLHYYECFNGTLVDKYKVGCDKVADEPATTVEVCSNGIDDDSDGLTDELEEGEQCSVTVNKAKHTVKLLGVSSSIKAVISVDGQSKEVTLGNIYEISGVSVFVESIDYQASGDIASQAVLSLSEANEASTLAWNCETYCNLQDGDFVCERDGNCVHHIILSSASEYVSLDEGRYIRNWDEERGFGCEKYISNPYCTQVNIDGSRITRIDECNRQGKLVTWSCKGFACAADINDCGPDGECLIGNSKCSPKVPLCTEDDFGYSPFVAGVTRLGTVAGVTHLGTDRFGRDECGQWDVLNVIGGHFGMPPELKEFYCEDDQLKSRVISCENEFGGGRVCKDGRCVYEETQCTYQGMTDSVGDQILSPPPRDQVPEGTEIAGFWIKINGVTVNSEAYYGIDESQLAMLQTIHGSYSRQGNYMEGSSDCQYMVDWIYRKCSFYDGMKDPCYQSGCMYGEYGECYSLYERPGDHLTGEFACSDVLGNQQVMAMVYSGYDTRWTKFTECVDTCIDGDCTDAICKHGDVEFKLARDLEDPSHGYDAKATRICNNGVWEPWLFADKTEVRAYCYGEFLDAYKCDGTILLRALQLPDCTAGWVTDHECPDRCHAGKCYSVPIFG